LHDYADIEYDRLDNDRSHPAGDSTPDSSWPPSAWWDDWVVHGPGLGQICDECGLAIAPAEKMSLLCAHDWRAISSPRGHNWPRWPPLTACRQQSRSAARSVVSLSPFAATPDWP